jgi:TolB-like protein/Flp pilus assembly protein TadD
MTEFRCRFGLELIGPFRLRGPDGSRIEISSKRGMALIAMVATGRGGERTRSWLQDRLWGSRQLPQAQASLRRELSNLRRAIAACVPEGSALVQSDHNRVWIDREVIDIVERGEGEFLEGLDIVGEDGFEDWLRLERTADRRIPNSGSTSRPDEVNHATIAVPQFAGRASLAVLPFVDQTGDEGNRYIAEGISEDLIDRLSRLRWLLVIARSSSFKFGGDNIDPKVIGETLGARYLLEGRMRRSGDQLHLSASLSDTATGFVVWTNRLTLAGDLTSAMVEQLALGLVGAIDARIDAEEQRRVLHRPPSDTNVNDLLWRGRWHFNQFTSADAAAALGCFEKALSLEPHSPEALIQHAWSMLRSIWIERKSDARIREMRQLANRAIIADADDGRGYLIAGTAESWLRQPLRAEALLRKAITLNPSLVAAHAQLGTNAYLSGRPEDAVAPLRTAIRLSPADHVLFFMLGELAMSHMMVGEWDAAIDYAERSIALRPGYWFAHVAKLNALARGGRAAEVAEANREFTANCSQFREDDIDWIPFVEPKWHAHLKDGLRRARQMGE